jgi:heptosyltransferase-2
LNPGEVKKIVARGANWVGDAVMTIPALRRLRGVFQKAHITLYTPTWAEGIFRDANFIDRVMSFEKNGSRFNAVNSQARAWREENFDLAVLFTNSFESALLAKLGRAKTRIGYANEGRSFLLTKSIALPEWKNQRHEGFYYLNLVDEIARLYDVPLPSEEAEPEFVLAVSEERKQQAREMLAAHGIHAEKELVAFCPGATNSRAKQWPAENYGRLGDMLAEKGAQVVLLGDKSEREAADRVAQRANSNPKNLAGKTSLAEATAILAVCDLLISNDTGPAHIAAAVGTPTLVIFGPTNHLTTQPLGSVMVREEVDCSPCMLRDCPIDHRCMTRILPEDVFAKIAYLPKATANRKII